MFDINKVTRTDINEIDWEAAPTSFDQSGTLYNIQLANIDEETDEPQLILAHDINSGNSSIAAKVNGHWFDTSTTQDWGVFDRLFGRKEWQALVAEHQAEAIAEIDADDED